MARAATSPSTLPEVTEAHRRAAFKAMGWAGWTFEEAMADDTRRRVVEARAHQLRKRQWHADARELDLHRAVAGLQTAMREARYTPHVGSPSKPWPPTVHDLKRAAAGDLDD